MAEQGAEESRPGQLLRLMEGIVCTGKQRAGREGRGEDLCKGPGQDE